MQKTLQYMLHLWEAWNTLYIVCWKRFKSCTYSRLRSTCVWYVITVKWHHMTKHICTGWMVWKEIFIWHLHRLVRDLLQQYNALGALNVEHKLGWVLNSIRIIFTRLLLICEIILYYCWVLFKAFWWAIIFLTKHQSKH